MKAAVGGLRVAVMLLKMTEASSCIVVLLRMRMMSRYCHVSVLCVHLIFGWGCGVVDIRWQCVTLCDDVIHRCKISLGKMRRKTKYCIRNSAKYGVVEFHFGSNYIYQCLLWQVRVHYPHILKGTFCLSVWGSFDRCIYDRAALTWICFLEYAQYPNIMAIGIGSLIVLERCWMVLDHIRFPKWTKCCSRLIERRHDNDVGGRHLKPFCFNVFNIYGVWMHPICVDAITHRAVADVFIIGGSDGSLDIREVQEAVWKHYMECEETTPGQDRKRQNDLWHLEFPNVGKCKYCRNFFNV